MIMNGPGRDCLQPIEINMKDPIFDDFPIDKIKYRMRCYKGGSQPKPPPPPKPPTPQDANPSTQTAARPKNRGFDSTILAGAFDPQQGRGSNLLGG